MKRHRSNDRDPNRGKTPIPAIGSWHHFTHRGEQVSVCVYAFDNNGVFARDDLGRNWFAPLADWGCALLLPEGE